jgi:hypothetical protein
MASKIGRTRRRLRTSSRTVLSAVAITSLTATGVVVYAGAASAAVPKFPDNIVVFPDRDFVSVEGYMDPFYAGQTALLEVTRAGTVIGSAKAVISGTDVAFEVNHPGGVCWGAGTSHQVTPDIRPGDVVSLSLPDGLKDETTVADTYVTKDMTLNGNVITVDGHVAPSVNKAQMEQRIINPDLKDTDVGRRDLRAVPGEVTTEAAYTSTLEFPTDTTFLATYTFVDPATAAIAASADLGERSMAWQVEDADANRQGLTIAEYGEAGGPGMGGCPAGPGDQAAPTPGTAQVVRSADKTSLSVKWEPTAAQAGAEPVSGYSIMAIGNTVGANGQQVQLGTRTDANATSTTIKGLDPAENYTVEVRSMAGPKMSEAFSTTVAAPAPTDPALGDTTPPTLTVDPAPVADSTTPVEATSVSATSDGQIYYTTGTDLVISGGLPSDAAQPYTGPIAITAPTTLHIASFDDAGNYTVTEGMYAPPAPTGEPAPDPVPPAAPTGLTATPGQGSATLRWDAGDASVTGYQVTVYDAGVALATQPAETTARTQTVTGLTAGKEYGFTVKAMAGTLASAESTMVMATPQAVTDSVTIGSARWKSGEFRVSGTGSVPGATITLHLVNADGTIGAAIPRATATVVAAVPPEVGGDWSIRLRDNAAPATNPGRIIAKSSNGGQTAPFTVTRG